MPGMSSTPSISSISLLAVVPPGQARSRPRNYLRNRGRHAVGKAGVEAIVPEELPIIMGVDVDEARRDEPLIRVDRLGGRSVHVADRDDAAVLDRDIAPAGQRTGPVDDGAVADKNIKHRSLHTDRPPDERRNVAGLRGDYLVIVYPRLSARYRCSVSFLRRTGKLVSAGTPMNESNAVLPMPSLREGLHWPCLPSVAARIRRARSCVGPWFHFVPRNTLLNAAGSDAALSRRKPRPPRLATQRKRREAF